MVLTLKTEMKFKQTEIGEIPEDWRVQPFREILVDNIRHGIYKSKEYFGRGVRLLKMGVQYSSDRIGPQEMELVELDDAEINRFKINEGELVFSRTSMMTDGAGKCSIVIKHSGIIVFDGNLLCANLNKLIAHPLFFYYYFNSAIAKQKISEITSGTQSRNISGSNLMKLPITMPIIEEQRAIADVLSCLDSKVELNREMNKTLEEMAQALFKRWFVDFEFPNENGEPYKSSGGKMIKTEQGEIPKGWRLSCLGNIVEVKGGGTPSTTNSSYWENGTISWATPKDLSQLTFPVLLKTNRKITELGLTVISSGLLPSGTLLLSSRAPVGYLAISDIPVAINQGFIAIMCDKEISNLFMLYWCKYNLEKIKGMSNGTTFQEVNKANFRNISIILPPINLIKLFTDKTKLLYAQIVNNEKQTEELTQIRNLLLPRLMSGKIRVPLSN